MSRLGVGSDSILGLVIVLFAFKENDGSNRESGEVRARYEGYTEPVHLMSELARGEIRLYRDWVIAH